MTARAPRHHQPPRPVKLQLDKELHPRLPRTCLRQQLQTQPQAPGQHSYARRVLDPIASFISRLVPRTPTLKMFATKALRQASAAAAHAERTPLIKFLGKRSIPSSIDHTPHAHPASPSHELPADFTSKSSAPSFSSYRQNSQQHGPLGRASGTGMGSLSGQSLGSVAPQKGEFFDRSQLPARFQRAPIDLSEIDAIETGGATLVC